MVPAINTVRRRGVDSADMLDLVNMVLSNVQTGRVAEAHEMFEKLRKSTTAECIQTATSAEVNEVTSWSKAADRSRVSDCPVITVWSRWPSVTFLQC